MLESVYCVTEFMFVLFEFVSHSSDRRSEFGLEEIRVFLQVLSSVFVD